ncbi:hypothetical protein ABWK22_02215 [Gottfriedia acidiceleris]|uniref:hypothetical protein n=1 Tax=Gottfriedia acidiceleris TaxID=371036 RepID=UPI0033995213
MDYTKKIDEAIELFMDLATAATKKEKFAVIEEMKNNEIADKLLKLLKDETVHVVDLALTKVVEKDKNRRLKNFVQFVKTIDELAGEKLEASVLHYILRHVDDEELEMYKAILTNAISIPVVNETVKEVKEVAKEKIQEVESK